MTRSLSQEVRAVAVYRGSRQVLGDPHVPCSVAGILVIVPPCPVPSLQPRWDILREDSLGIDAVSLSFAEIERV